MVLLMTADGDAAANADAPESTWNRWEETSAVVRGPASAAVHIPQHQPVVPPERDVTLDHQDTWDGPCLTEALRNLLPHNPNVQVD